MTHVITISRELGFESEEVAENIVDTLGCHYSEKLNCNAAHHLLNIGENLG
jgi:hypothetical protein